MEARSDSSQARSGDNKLPPPAAPKPRVQVWFVTVCSTILIWTCLVQLFAAGELWRTRIFTGQVSRFSAPVEPVPLPPPLPPPSLFFFTLSGCVVVFVNESIDFFLYRKLYKQWDSACIV